MSERALLNEDTQEETDVTTASDSEETGGCWFCARADPREFVAVDRGCSVLDGVGSQLDTLEKEYPPTGNGIQIGYDTYKKKLAELCKDLDIEPPKEEQAKKLFHSCDANKDERLQNSELHTAVKLGLVPLLARKAYDEASTTRKGLNFDQAKALVGALCRNLRVHPPGDVEFKTEFFWHDFDHNHLLGRSGFQQLVMDFNLATRQSSSQARTKSVQVDTPQPEVRTTLVAEASEGDKRLVVDSVRHFVVGNRIRIGDEGHEEYHIAGFAIDEKRGVALNCCLELDQPLDVDEPFVQGTTVVALRDMVGVDPEDDDPFDKWDPGHLIEGWIPRERVDPSMRKVLRNRERKLKQNDSPNANRLKVELSDFEVVGPAVLWSSLALVLWFFVIALCGAAYMLTPPVEKPAVFSAYPTWLWCFVVLIYLGHFWVQMKVLSFVVVAQVQQTGKRRGFTIGGCSLSFYGWLVAMFFLGSLDVLDLASHSFLFGKFAKSYQTNSDIANAWEQIINQSGYVSFVNRDMGRFFFLCWALILVQPLCMIFMLVPTHNQNIDYGYSSMAEGYRTLMSFMMRFDISANAKGNHDSCWGCSDQRRYWHADVLRVMCEYGRLTAVTWENRTIMVKRLEKAGNSEGKLRFMQIHVSRVTEHISHLLCVDIIEKAFKLEMQISMVALAHALAPRRVPEAYSAAAGCVLSTMALDERWKDVLLGYDWQILLSIAMAVLSSIRAFAVHVQNYRKLNDMFRKYVIDKENDEQLTEEEEKIEHSCRVAKGYMCCYLCIICMLFLFILHCLYKLIMVVVCDNAVVNIGGGCVEFAPDSPWMSQTSA